MSVDPIFFAPLKVPLTDARTGLMSREWYLFFQAMFLRIGGAQAFTPDDLQITSEVSDATEDGNDIRAYTADLERAITLDELQIPTDLGELQMLSAAFVEDPVPLRANPTAVIGLAAVNGTAVTFTTSDSAPPLSQAIAPTWTGAHTFSLAITVNGAGSSLKGAVTITAPAAGNSLTVNGVASGIPVNLVTPAVGNYPLQFTDGSHIGGFFTSGTAGQEVQFGSVSNHGLAFFTNNASPALQISTAKAVQVNGPLGVNSTAPPAKVTGFGTPTGTGVIANFPGATATLAQCSQAIAQIITDLKAFGLYGT